MRSHNLVLIRHLFFRRMRHSHAKHRFWVKRNFQTGSVGNFHVHTTHCQAVAVVRTARIFHNAPHINMTRARKGRRNCNQRKAGMETDRGTGVGTGIRYGETRTRWR